MKNMTMDTDETNLLDWIKNNKGYIHEDLQINSNTAEGNTSRCIYYTNNNNIKSGEEITKIPFELAISEDTFFGIPGIDEWVSFAEENKPELSTTLESSRFRIMIALLHEVLKGDNSFYYPFIKILPKSSNFKNHPINIYYKDKNSLNPIKGFSSHFLKKVDIACTELSLIIKTVQLCNQNKKILDPKTHSEKNLNELIEWAYFIHLTRSWGNYLIPYNCFFNHSNKSTMSYAGDKNHRPDYFCIKADDQYENTNGTAQVFGNYSHYDSMSLFLTYDFLYEYGKEMKFLSLPFALRNTPDLNRQKNEEIDRCNINTKKLYICKEGPPRSLLSILRIASMTEDEFTLLSKSEDANRYNKPISLKNEIKSLSLLLKIVLDFKKTTHTNDNLCAAHDTLNHYRGKSLSATEHVIKNVSTITLVEHEILNGSLDWISTLLQNAIHNARITN